VIKSLVVAIADAIEADATLAGLLAGAKVYNGLAPEESPFNYITLSNFAESERNLFNLEGSQSTSQFAIWTKGEGEMDVLTIYEALHDLFHNKRLTLDVGQHIRGKLRLIMTGAGDQSDATIVRGVVEYAMRAVK
jgi:hypothetical protein